MEGQHPREPGSPRNPVSHGADIGAPGQVERRPLDRSSRTPGQRNLMAVFVLTGVVMVFAAAVAIWMYWLQG